MANLIYLAIASLDGYVEDEQGTFDWVAPDEEVRWTIISIGGFGRLAPMGTNP